MEDIHISASSRCAHLTNRDESISKPRNKNKRKGVVQCLRAARTQFRAAATTNPSHPQFRAAATTNPSHPLILQCLTGGGELLWRRRPPGRWWRGPNSEELRPWRWRQRRALHGMGSRGCGGAGDGIGRGGAGGGGHPWRRWSGWRRSWGRLEEVVGALERRRRPSRRGRAAAGGGGLGGGAGGAVERSREGGENEVGNFDLGLSP
jgi:hypothetical protein